MSATFSEPAAATSPHRGTWKTGWYTATNYLFILPFMILFFTFTVGPILYAFWMSLHDWPILAKVKPFVGLDNYQALLRDNLWWLSLRNSLYFAFLTATGMTVFSLIVALGVSQPIRGRDFYRFIFYAPVILSVAVMGLIAGWMMNTQFGIVNYFLKWWFDIGPVPWLSSPTLVIPSLSLATIWWGFGFPMLIYIAGLQNIPSSTYEAARIDGANSFQLTRFITLPLLRPTILFVAVTQLIAHFQVFGQPYIMTGGGGPGRASYTTIIYLYQTAWRFYRMGYGTTIAIGLAIVILIFTAIQLAVLGRNSAVEY